MIKEYKRSADDVNVLPRGINSVCTRYTEYPVEEERHTIMYFGRIWGYKGIRYLIEAEPFITEKFPDAKIVIAGQGEDFQKYREMMVHKDKFIVHNKFIPYKMVSELFQKASVIVLPYIDGSQSGVIPQAYAFIKPVVATDVGGLPESVDHGVTGYIVPPRDSKKLAEAIIDLLTDDEKRRKMGENAYRMTKEELSWESIAPKTVEVYKKAGWTSRPRGTTASSRKAKSCSSMRGPWAPILPAHAHCDALSFEWSVGGRRIVVDTGVDRYEAGPERDFQRGTAAHSTLQVEGLEQAECFGSFRMGRRPHVTGRRIDAVRSRGSTTVSARRGGTVAGSRGSLGGA